MNTLVKIPEKGGNLRTNREKKFQKFKLQREPRQYPHNDIVTK